ncbi:MAG: alanine racemase, partial [Chitinivibrionales bacterium]|nr:alanine racemase [Chitinivibrionales bacterium]
FLRENGIHRPILVFGECDTGEIRWGAKNNIRFSLNDIRSIDKFTACDAPVKVHCNIDTGMGRLGIKLSELTELSEALFAHENLELEGLYTHLASADNPDTATVERQLELFAAARSHLGTAGISPVHIHVANSAGIIHHTIKDCTLVRPGISLYGCKPDPSVEFDIDLKPVAALKGHVIKVKKTPPGTPISYGGTYITREDTVIATVPVGYAHGLPRLLSNKGSVLINGKRFPIAGTVTMDSVMVDCGNSTDVTVGDEAVVMGYQGPACISPDEIAVQCGTIGYEILCGLSTAVDRYILKNKVTIDYLPPFFV